MTSFEFPCFHGNGLALRQAQIVYWEVPDQGRVCNNQIEGKASGVCWDINVLGEVEAVQQMGKLGDTVGGLGVNKNVECWVLTRMILLLVVKRL